MCCQVNALGTESVRLQGIHGDQADQIRGKQEEMEQSWDQLRNKVCSFLPVLLQTYTCSMHHSRINTFQITAKESWSQWQVFALLIYLFFFFMSPCECHSMCTCERDMQSSESNTNVRHSSLLWLTFLEQ